MKILDGGPHPNFLNMTEGLKRSARFEPVRLEKRLRMEKNKRTLRSKSYGVIVKIICIKYILVWFASNDCHCLVAILLFI